MRTIRTGLLIALAYLTMLLFGGMDGLRGVSIPAVRMDLAVSYNAIGATFFVSMFAFIAALYGAGRLASNGRLKAILAIGLSLTVMAHLVAPFATHILLYALMMIALHFGGGWLEIGLNAVGAEVFRKRAAVGMSILHLFFGLGSTAFSRFGGEIIASEIGWRGAYFGAIFLTVPLLIWTLLIAFPRPADSPEASSESPLRALRDPLIRRIALLLGAAIIVEIGIGSWMANYLVTMRGLSEAQAGTWLAGFFAAFTVGRLICPFIAERFGYVRTLGAFGLGVLVMFIPGYILADFPLGLSLTGLFVSIMYPTVMAILMHEYPGRASRLMSPILILAITTANIGNWVIAGLHDLLGEQLAFGAVALTPIYMLITLLAVQRAVRRRSGEERTAH